MSSPSLPPSRRPTRWICVALLAVLPLLTSCGTPRVLDGRRAQIANADSFLPRVAVMPFDNRSNFSGQWALGTGFADLLTTYLLRTGRMVVLERNDIDDVLEELRLQNTGLVRQEGRAAESRLKNAEVLIRGVITEFTVTSDVSGWFGSRTADIGNTKLRDVSIRGNRRKARVSINMKVYDVETGEVLASVESAGSSSSGMLGGSAKYNQMDFGGEAFYKTPLGKATRQAMERAIHKIVNVMPRKAWQGRVAYAEGVGIIINGGKNVGVRLGDQFAIRGAPQPITDPISGEVIREISGDVVAEVVVEQVEDESAAARILYGQPQRGDLLERVTSSMRRTPESQDTKPASRRPLPPPRRMLLDGDAEAL